MTIYYIDDGGSNTSPFDTWAKAATSAANLVSSIAAALTTGTNVIYVGDDHNDPVTGASKTFTFAANANTPTQIISADRTDNNVPPAYKLGTGKQFRCDDGSFQMDISGAASFHGIRFAAGTNFRPLGVSAGGRSLSFYDCTYLIGSTGSISQGQTSSIYMENPVVDLTADGTTNRATAVFVGTGGPWEIVGGSFINAAWRSQYIFQGGVGSVFLIDGMDLSGFTNAGLPDIYRDNTTVGQFYMSHCKLPSTFSLATANNGPDGIGRIWNNIGSANSPQYLATSDGMGDLLSSTSIIRSGGATLEGVAWSWLITTTAQCFERRPFHSPWMYGKVLATGSKNFDVFITNDTADFTDAEVWMEVDMLGTAGSPKWTRIADKRATILTTAASQDADSSTWTGSGPAFSHKQRLRATGTVNVVGQFRCRVVVGKASIASSSFFYADPKPVVS